MRFVIKKHFCLFLRFYGNCSLSVCMLLMWLVGRGRGLPPCRVVTLKKASVSISLFLQLMVADEGAWKRNKTHEAVSIRGGSGALPTTKERWEKVGRQHLHFAASFILPTNAPPFCLSPDRSM